MSSEAVARRYARAVFDLAKEAGNVLEVAKHLSAYAEVYELSDEFRAIERTPGLSDDDRAGVDLRGRITYIRFKHQF